MKKVFISYVSENIEIVKRLYHELKAHGIQVWLDRNDIDPGSRWEQAIRRAIQHGTFFIACFSEEYNNRDKTYMNEELTLAIDELRQRSTDKIWFIPVRLNECEIPARSIGGGETLQAFHHVNLYEDWDGSIQRILRVIQSASSETTTNANTSEHRVHQNARAKFSENLTQILERIEKRIEFSLDTSSPNLTVIAHPVLPYGPVISTEDIYEFVKMEPSIPFNNLATDFGTRRVKGGVCFMGNRSGLLYWELNEYGIVYRRGGLARERSRITDNAGQFHDCLHFSAFAQMIGELINRAQSFYKRCEYFGHIEVTAQLQQVFGERLLYYDQFPKEDIERQRSSEPEIPASTQYRPRDLAKEEKFISVVDELAGQLLWAFNIDDDKRREKVEGILRKSGLVDPPTQ